MKDWSHGRVKDLIESLESGVSVNGSDDTPAVDEPAVLKVSAVTYGVFDPQASKPIRNPHELKRAKCNPRAGELLLVVATHQRWLEQVHISRIITQIDS